MAIRYQLIQRKDFTKGAKDDAKKYYATLVSNGSVSFESLCESISEETAMTSADVKSVLDRLPRIINRHLIEGRNVQVGELGSFRIALRSGGTSTVEEYDAAKQMRTPSMVFTPGKALRLDPSKLKYQRVKKEEQQTTPSEPTEDDNDGPDII